MMDPATSAAAPAAVYGGGYGGGAPAIYGGGAPAIYGGGGGGYGGGQFGSAGHGMAPAPAYNGLAALGLGTVGGSWSPEPDGNNQIIYGHYFSQGASALPQASLGQQFTAPVTSQATATTQPSTTTRSSAPATTSGGGDKPASAAGEDKNATTANKRSGKSVTVKSGDTLSKIAAANGMTWQKLYQLNKAVIGSNPNLIRPGQKLKLS